MQQNDGATPAPPERAEDIPPETGKKNDSYDVAAADAAVAAGAVAQVFENEPPRGVKDACGGKKLKKAVGAEGFVCLVLVAGFFVAFGIIKPLGLPGVSKKAWAKEKSKSIIC